MTMLARILTASAAIGALAAPAVAQYPYPQTYQQPYPNQGYGYSNNGGVVGSIIDSLLGNNNNRYSVSDRTAIQQCANAAVVKASQYRTNGYGQGYNGYPQGYNGQGYNGQGYNGQGYNGQGYGQARVTSISQVERRSNGLRVSGTLSSGAGYNNGYGNNGYGNNGYGNRAYGGGGDLSFRCDVDYRGYVTNVKINRYTAYRQGY